MRKSILLFLVFCVAAGIVLYQPNVPLTYANEVISPEGVLLGDVNGDGRVDSLDFAYIRMYLVGKISEFPRGDISFAAADIDKDGDVDSIDFAYVRKYLVGKGTFPPIPTPTPTLTHTATPTPVSTPTPSPTSQIISQFGFEFDMSTGTIIKYEGTSRMVIIPSMINSVKVRAIGDFAFSDRVDLFAVTIPDGVTRIGFRAFAHCLALRSVRLSRDLTIIDSMAFTECVSLTSITIPDSVTEIGWSAFTDCTGLREVIFLGNQPELLGGFIFSNAHPDFEIKVSPNAEGFGKPIPYNGETSWEWVLDFNPDYKVVASETLPTDEVITIRDEYLRSVVLYALGKSEDDIIYKSDIDKITDLSVVRPTTNDPIDLSELALLTNLERLAVRGFDLRDMQPFASLTNLTELEISYCSMDDPRAFKHLTKLVTLKIYFTNLNDLSPLENLTDLEMLVLSNNGIRDISPLRNLTKLTYLDLSNNHISDISPLENLTNLQYLNLSGNNITD